MRLGLKEIGPIKDANLNFGDLTIFVGPQASGKSIVLQWLKLTLDIKNILYRFSLSGIYFWEDVFENFLDSYFGDGMRNIWNTNSLIKIDGEIWDFQGKFDKITNDLFSEKIPRNKESVFLIPAHRALTLQDSWPRHFREFSGSAPYMIRAFSEDLRQLMEGVVINKKSSHAEKIIQIFPQERQLKKVYRDIIGKNIFADFSLFIDKNYPQQRLTLGEKRLKTFSYMAWSTGQREFAPLLLGISWLMPPSGLMSPKNIKWVIIEEPEMGLHPKAISTVLLLILELLARDYKVCLSTHSTQILEFAWALGLLKANGGKPKDVLGLVNAPNAKGLTEVAKKALQKETRVYYFEAGEETKDISHLDPDADEAIQANWGGLLEPSARANEIVANVMAKA